MKQYELVVMFSVEHNDVSAEKSITEKAKKHDIKIVSLDKWGVKSLAYPIKKQTKGYYLYYVVEASSKESIMEFEKLVRMDESIIRYLLVLVNNKKKK